MYSSKMEPGGSSRGQTTFNIFIVVLAVATISLAAIIIFHAASGNYGAPASRSGPLPVSTSDGSPPASMGTPLAEGPSVPMTNSPQSPPPPIEGLNSSTSPMLSDVRTAVRVVSKFWARHWSDFFPGDYIAPTVLGLYDGTAASPPLCGTEPLSADNAHYCHDADFVAWDVGLMSKGYEDGDAWPYLVVAHEWAHAIQARVGHSLTLTATELQADCLAGAALFGAAIDGDLLLEPGDQSELAVGLSRLGDETPWTRTEDHGDSFQRIDAFNQGRLGGILPCFPTMKTAPLGTTLAYASGTSISVVSLGFQRVSPGSVGAVQSEAAVFQITVHNTSSRALPASHMMKPRVGYGTRSITADLVNDTAAGLGSDTLGVIPPGETRTGFIGAGVPSAYASLVRVDVRGPDPARDWPASFTGAIEPG